MTKPIQLLEKKTNKKTPSLTITETLDTQEKEWNNKRKQDKFMIKINGEQKSSKLNKDSNFLKKNLFVFRLLSAAKAINNRRWRGWDFDHVRVHEHSLFPVRLVRKCEEKKRKEKRIPIKKKRDRILREREKRLGIQREVWRRLHWWWRSGSGTIKKDGWNKARLGLAWRSEREKWFCFFLWCFWDFRS